MAIDLVSAFSTKSHHRSGTHHHPRTLVTRRRMPRAAPPAALTSQLRVSRVNKYPSPGSLRQPLDSKRQNRQGVEPRAARYSLRFQFRLIRLPSVGTGSAHHSSFSSCLLPFLSRSRPLSVDWRRGAVQFLCRAGAAESLHLHSRSRCRTQVPRRSPRHVRQPQSTPHTRRSRGTHDARAATRTQFIAR